MVHKNYQNLWGKKIYNLCLTYNLCIRTATKEKSIVLSQQMMQKENPSISNPRIFRNDLNVIGKVLSKSM
jgi:hypothetical protein